MKRIATLLVGLLLSTITLSAQGLTDPWWGVRAGVNFSNLSSMDYSTGYLTGYNVGVIYAHPISNFAPIYLESGLYYQKRGARDNGFLIENGGESRLTQYELEVPLLLGYQTQLTGEWSIQSVVGLFYSVALDGSFVIGDDEFDPYQLEMLQTLRNSEATMQKLLHRSNFGVRVGVTVLYERFSVGFLFDGGLCNLYSRALRDVGYIARTGCLTIQGGYNF
ncbi:MAG: outer membrane beta-barrel protein [Rikenellaceae bacterium]